MTWHRHIVGATMTCDIERGDLSSHGDLEQMIFEAHFSWVGDADGVYDVQAYMPDRGGWRELALTDAERDDWARHIESRLQDEWWRI